MPTIFTAAEPIRFIFPVACPASTIYGDPSESGPNGSKEVPCAFWASNLNPSNNSRRFVSE